MKLNHLLFYAIGFIVASCSDYVDEPIASTTGTISQCENSQSRSIENEDSTTEEEYVPLKFTDQMRSLKEIYESLRSSQPQLLVYSSPTDEYYESNMKAIEGLNMYIRVRKAGDTSTANRVYMSSDGAGKSINMRRSQEIDDRFRFYIKKPISSSGIPYLIYSYKTNTPLAVGISTSDPQNPQKSILMIAKDESDLYACSWDLIPRDSTGYFSIESQSYMGQSDPNNPFSIFYYVMEAMDNNKTRFAKSVAGKREQAYYLDLNVSFYVSKVDFQLDNATVTAGPDLIANTINLTNSTEFGNNYPFTASLTSNESSLFIQNDSKIAFKLRQSILFPRPIPVARRATLNNNTPKDASYIGNKQTFSKTVSTSNTIYVNARTLCQIKTRFKSWNLSVPYVMTATYEGKEIKLKGTWKGYALANPEIDHPVLETRFYNLDTGEETTSLLHFDTTKNMYVTQ